MCAAEVRLVLLNKICADDVRFVLMKSDLC